MSHTINAESQESLSDEALAEVRGGTSYDTINDALRRAVEEVARAARVGANVFPQGPVLKPLPYNPNDARTLIFF
jgi:hypothetical protein